MSAARQRSITRQLATRRARSRNAQPTGLSEGVAERHQNLDGCRLPVATGEVMLDVENQVGPWG